MIGYWSDRSDQFPIIGWPCQLDVVRRDMAVEDDDAKLNIVTLDDVNVGI